ncbi:MAG: hypothetical protein CM1200mP20_04000 [Pseudomonadota bacterium]|nr:MAG: hypothetical protein CM1200mP20_04000 [Pseudomonadota bacterium]
MMPLTGRVIMISGASRGIGLAVARRLLRAGARLSLGARGTRPPPKEALGPENTQAVGYFAYSGGRPGIGGALDCRPP